MEVTEWPRVYRERNEIQENSFKRMIDHGALNTNYGRKKIVGPDRHQQRAREKLDQSLEAAQKRVDKKAEAVKAQQDKVAESASKGHGKRLEQRQRALVVLEQEMQDAQHKHDQFAEQAASLGPPRQRADRDFRKQTIMTVRTLLLENALTVVHGRAVGDPQTKVSLDCILHILFERSGARMETGSQVVYWVNTAGLSAAYQRLLTRGGRRAVCDGLAGSRQTDSRAPQRHAALRRLSAWADRMSIFSERLSEVRLSEHQAKIYKNPNKGPKRDDWPRYSYDSPGIQAKPDV